MPTLTEWKITAGIWAVGLMVLTVALTVLSGQRSAHSASQGGAVVEPETKQAA